MLESRGISVFYGRHRALENVSLSVSKGEIVVMLGANLVMGFAAYRMFKTGYKLKA